MKARLTPAQWLAHPPKTITEHLLRSGLNLLSVPYSAITWTRGMMYDHRILPVHRLSCPVICIGNITTGGTGKTPIVRYMAELLRDEGRTVAILSRGYKRPDGKGPLLVRDQEAIRASWRTAGDEPLLLAQNLSGVVLLVGSNRWETGQIAIKDYQADIIVLDDGFSHRQLFRDLDFVLLDVTNPFGYGKMLPSGLLREPVSAIERAEAVILTRTRPGETYPELEHTLLKYHIHKPIFRFISHLGPIRDARTNESIPFSRLPNPLLAFSGIGNPVGFNNTLTDLALTPVQTLSYPDHYTYQPADWAELNRLAKKYGAKGLFTTEKDVIKLKDYISDSDLPLMYPELRMEPEDKAAFSQFIQQRISLKNQASLNML